MSEDYAQMVEGCRRHDRRAQRALYDAFAPMALGVCMRYATDRDAAQDLLQDGMVQVFEKLGQVRDPQELGAWVYRLMVNTCLQQLRRQKRAGGMWESLTDAATGADIDGGTTVAFDDPFAMEEVVMALQKLPPAQRMAFNMVEVDGYPIGEAAQRMRCSQSNVRSLVSRAKGRLREMLTDATRSGVADNKG